MIYLREDVDPIGSESEVGHCWIDLVQVTHQGRLMMTWGEREGREGNTWKARSGQYIFMNVLMSSFVGWDNHGLTSGEG